MQLFLCIFLVLWSFSSAYEGNPIICVNQGNTNKPNFNPAYCNAIVFQHEFFRLFGPKPKLTQVVNSSDPLFHEGPVYVEKTNEFYFTSNRLGDTSGPNQFILLQKISLDNPQKIEIVHPSGNPIIMPNGGTRGKNGRLVFCSQGQIGINGAIVEYNPRTNKAEVIVDNYQGLSLNSPNDVILSKKDGSYWFTDPHYGYIQLFRDVPQLANAVWRYDPKTNIIHPIADGFQKPNGLTLSADEKKLYVADSGYFDDKPCCTANAIRPRAVYVFDVTPARTVQNRRLLYTAPKGIPDGIKVDCVGNLYIGTGNGLTVFNDEGVQLGEIIVPGDGVINFDFAGDKILLLSERIIYSLPWHNPCDKSFEDDETLLE